MNVLAYVYRLLYDYDEVSSEEIEQANEFLRSFGMQEGKRALLTRQRRAAMGVVSGEYRKFIIEQMRMAYCDEDVYFTWRAFQKELEVRGSPNKKEW